MEHISWTMDLEVGVTLIDDQHKQFFKAANALAEAMFEGRSKEQVGKTLDFFLEYAQIHFRDEENLMINNGYPEYPNQKRAHEAFVKQIITLQERYQAGESTSALSIELLNGACEWLRNHIRLMDKPMGQNMQSKI